MFRTRKLIKVVAITTRGCDVRITEWLKILASKDGSDLYLSTGAPPCAKFDGQLKPIDNQILTEIAFDVGFSDVSYFSRCFKEHFGCPPSKYRAQKAEERASAS